MLQISVSGVLVQQAALTRTRYDLSVKLYCADLVLLLC